LVGKLRASLVLLKGEADRPDVERCRQWSGETCPTAYPAAGISFASRAKL
jgi:hypothetical protein